MLVKFNENYITAFTVILFLFLFYLIYIFFYFYLYIVPFILYVNWEKIEYDLLL